MINGVQVRFIDKVCVGWLRGNGERGVRARVTTSSVEAVHRRCESVSPSPSAPHPYSLRGCRPYRRRGQIGLAIRDDLNQSANDR